jgi:hypothetical protein
MKPPIKAIVVFLAILPGSCNNERRIIIVYGAGNGNVYA